jgi:hypothetical protein
MFKEQLSYVVTAYRHAVATFQVLTAASMNMTAFWDMAPCSLVKVDRRFRYACWLIALIMEAVRISETSAYFNKTTRRCICCCWILVLFKECGYYSFWNMLEAVRTSETSAYFNKTTRRCICCCWILVLFKERVLFILELMLEAGAILSYISFLRMLVRLCQGSSTFSEQRPH